MSNEPLGEIARRLGDFVAVRNSAPSAAFCTYRVGGPIALMVEVDSVDHLLAASSLLKGLEVDVLVVGRGSNLLIADSGFDGIVLRLGSGFEHVSCDMDTQTVRAGGGTSLPVLARQSSSEGLRGLEFFVGIPGSVGGAVRMNAGGHGSETSEVLRSASVLEVGSLQIIDVAASQLGFSYRHSAIAPNQIVVEAIFDAVRGDPEEARAEIDEIVRWRRQNQPGGQNCGSVFTNPEGDSAGRLIDACGLKGTRLGGAVVSSKHANFIQAEQGATAQDVFDLIHHVRWVVAESTGIELSVELQLVGFEYPTIIDRGVRA